MNQERVDRGQKDILVVDDTPANVRVLAEMLTKHGYRVRKALNGQMALTACQTLLPDLILLDIMMPEMDGYEVCQHLKADERTCKIPVIFLSALNDVLDKVRAFNAGGVDYITKPFQIEEVLVRVENQLTIQHLQKRLTEQNEALAGLNQNLEKLVEQKTKQLIDQEKTALIGRLTQGMMHNLKNPIQTIMVCSDLIEAEASEIDNEFLVDYSQTIKLAAREINQIMDSMLFKSLRDKSPDLKPVNINELLQNELQLLTANLHFKHEVKKTYLLDEQIPHILLIYSHISQVFHNLINNAVDAMWNKENQELAIVTRQDETSVYMDVKDTGCGIAAENLSKIFDPFYTSKPAKGEETTAGEPTGTGLGLYTCVELLKPFSGKILVTSEVGKGSVFTVVLPKQIGVP